LNSAADGTGSRKDAQNSWNIVNQITEKAREKSRLGIPGRGRGSATAAAGRRSEGAAAAGGTAGTGGATAAGTTAAGPCPVPSANNLEVFYF